MKKALSLPLQISLCAVGYLWATGSNIQAQVTTDGTVNTIVTPNGNVAEITGGETRDSNLFHSFQEFSVGTGNEAFFNNANDISNIFSRVTGGNISNIDGVIRANGSASLFLINPAGIIFGENASLSLGGSFYGSSASSILFENGEFSAADLENPPLLTVNAPIGLGFRDNPADINVTGNSNTGVFANLTVNPGQNFTLVGGNLSFDTGVAIAPGGRIEVGGLSESGVVSLNEDFSFSFPENVARADIDFTNGAGISVASEEGGSINLNARNLNLTGGSQIIGGLTATGVIVSDAEAGDVVINATDTITLDGINPVSGSNSAIFNNVESGAVGNAGDVQISAKNLSLANGGQIQTIIRQANPVLGLSPGEGNAGNININVEEAITVSGISDVINVGGFDNSFPSSIASSLDLGTTGESGAISITSGSLALSDGGRILSSTFGQGNAGNITLNISNDISLDGVNTFISQGLSSGSFSGIFSNVESGAVGDGGFIDIQAKNLSITNGSQIQTIVRQENPQLQLAPGNGNAGDIKIKAEEAVNISGVSDVVNLNGLDSSFPSLISSSLDLGTTGESGDISITSGSFALNDGGVIQSSTGGIGNAGNITLDISNDISFDGVNQTTSGGILGGIFSNVESGAEGNGGVIDIQAKNLSITNGAQIQTTVRRGQNFNGQEIAPGNGIAGDINIDVEEAVTISGVSDVFNANGVENSFASLISSVLDFGATGESGAISITSGSFILSDGGVIQSSTGGVGNAGNITLDISNDINFDGVNQTISGGILGGIFSNVESGAEGNGGVIDIQAKNFAITNGAQIQTTVRRGQNFNGQEIAPGNGIAGDINIDVEEAVTISGVSDIFNAGGIENSFASLISSVLDLGATGESGTISITSGSFTLSDGGAIQSSTLGIGNAGNITLNIANDLNIDGANQVISQGSSSDALSSILSNVESGAVGNGGVINIQANNLSLTNGGQIQTIVRRGQNFNGQEFLPGNGNAGNIKINAEEVVAISGVSDVLNVGGFDSSFPSLISSSLDFGATGESGAISITSGSLALNDGSVISSSTFGTGDAGNITLDIDNNLNIDGVGQVISQGNLGAQLSGIFSSVESGAVGNGGVIDIQAKNLSITNGAQIQTVVRRGFPEFQLTPGNGIAGEIKIDIEEAVTISGISDVFNAAGVDNSFASLISSSLDLGASGESGVISITSGSLSLNDGGQIFSSTGGIGNAGNITLNLANDLNIDGASQLVSQGIPSFSLSNISSSTVGQGNAGNISINVGDSITLSNLGQIDSSVLPGGDGNAGNIDIETGSLALRGGSQISTAVFREGFREGFITPGGIGDGGNITINATDFVDISGVSTTQLDILDLSGDPENTTRLIPTEGFSSGLIANSERGASGNAGNITVTTGSFRLADGAVVDSLTANEGNGGNITINANTFEATGGGQVLTTTRDTGNAGTIKLNIAKNISISGSDPNFESRLARANEFGSIQGGNNIVNNQGAESGIFANTEQNATGDGGSILIGIFKPEGNDLILDNTKFTESITIANDARIAADSQGKGNGGRIFIRAEDLTLSNQAQIIAETNFPQPAEIVPSEINLSIADNLYLRENSTISAQAFNNASGGNIDIDANFIVAFPNQIKGNGSDIIANAAEEGTGGEITISAESLFGIDERDATLNNQTNDIDASSEFGLDGTISIFTPDINPIQGTTELPNNIVEPQQTTAQACATNREVIAQNSLTIKGKGGIPPTPDLPLNSQNIFINGESANSTSAIPQPIETSYGKIQPARGIKVTKDGEIVLTAYRTNNSGDRLPEGSINCNGV